MRHRRAAAGTAGAVCDRHRRGPGALHLGASAAALAPGPRHAHDGLPRRSLGGRADRDPVRRQQRHLEPVRADLHVRDRPRRRLPAARAPVYGRARQPGRLPRPDRLRRRSLDRVRRGRDRRHRDGADDERGGPLRPQQDPRAAPSPAGPEHRQRRAGPLAGPRRDVAGDLADGGSRAGAGVRRGRARRDRL